MQEVLSQLIELQKIDTRVHEIESVIKNMPLLSQNLQEKLAKADAGFESIQNEMSENKAAYAKLEKEIHEKKELLTSSQKKLTSVQNNKEYESVLRELDTLKKNIIEGDNKLKEMLNTSFKYESEFATITELKENIKKQIEELNQNKTDEDKELHTELAVLNEKRVAFIPKIKKPILSKYDKIREHRNNIGVASVKDEVCNGCYMRIPPQLYVDIKKDTTVNQCPHCQRLLYYVKDVESK